MRLCDLSICQWLCSFLFISTFALNGEGTALAISCELPPEPVDVIVMSKDRPLQLYALLESIYAYMTGIHQISVIYHVRNEQFSKAYAKVSKAFPQVEFVAQSRSNPRGDFKSIVCRVLHASQVPYVMFAVDDIVVTDTVALFECAKNLQSTGAYGFYLRLGKDITESYSDRCVSGLPGLRNVSDTMYQWTFSASSGEWRYPNSLDMTVFDRTMVLHTFEKLAFCSPNTLEGTWAAMADFSKKGLCFEQSKMINIPLNLVQIDWKNRYMGASDCGANELLLVFERGYKIDIHEMYRLPHCAPHVSHRPLFIERDGSVSFQKSQKI